MKEFGYCTPKVFLFYDIAHYCFISCRCNSKWEYEIKNNNVQLINKDRTVKFYIGLEEFNDNWKIIDLEGNRNE